MHSTHSSIVSHLGPDGTAASGHVKPPPFPSSDKDRPSSSKPNSEPSGPAPSGSDTFSGPDTFGGSDSFSGPVSPSGSSETAPESPPDSGYQGPSFSQGSGSEDITYVDEDVSNFGGAKPTKGPGDE